LALADKGFEVSALTGVFSGSAEGSAEVSAEVLAVSAESIIMISDSGIVGAIEDTLRGVVVGGVLWEEVFEDILFY
jgi:hypothetical protein